MNSYYLLVILLAIFISGFKYSEYQKIDLSDEREMKGRGVPFKPHPHQMWHVFCIKSTKVLSFSVEFQEVRKIKDYQHLCLGLVKSLCQKLTDTFPF